MNQTKHDHLLNEPGVNQEFARKVRAVLQDIRGHGGSWYLFEVKRTRERQRFLFAIGRSTKVLLKNGYSIDEVNRFRKQGAKVNVPQVTGTLSSAHLRGIAADIVPLIDGEPSWDVPKELWNLIGSSARAHGLVWGGNWKSVDRPHVQLGS